MVYMSVDWHFVYPWDWYFAGLPLHKILRAVLGLRGVGVPVAVDTGTWMSTRLYLLDVHRYRAMVGSLAQQSPDVLHSRATDTWETTVTKLARKAGLRRHGLIDATRSWSVHFPNQQLRPDGDEKGPLDLDSMQVAIVSLMSQLPRYLLWLNLILRMSRVQNRVVQRGVAVTSNKEYTAANVYKWVHKAKWLDNVADDVDISTRSVVLTVSIYVVSFAAVLGATYYGLRILFNGGQIT